MKQTKQQIIEKQEFIIASLSSFIEMTSGKEALDQILHSSEKEWLVEQTNETYRQMSFLDSYIYKQQT